MLDSNYFRFSNSVLFAPILFVIIIWAVYWMELKYGINLNVYGIYPRTISGLKGIVFSPFIHGSLQHLYNNTIPVTVLMAALFYFYNGIGMRVLIYGMILSGLITWLIGRPSFHIGASGMIYVLASFIFFKGIFSKYYRLVALSLLVVFMYGSLLWYVFPIEKGISWEGHLGGFISGLCLAIFIKGELPKPQKYVWESEDYNEEEDPFLQQFDEEGNFIESSEVHVDEGTNDIEIKYHFKKNDENSTP